MNVLLQMNLSIEKNGSEAIKTIILYNEGHYTHTFWYQKKMMIH